MTRRLNNRFIFYICLAMLMMVLFGHFFLNMNIPQIVPTGIMILMVMIGGQSEILAVSLCCIPLHSVINFFSIVCICILFYIIKNFQNIRVGKTVIIGLVIFLWELLHGILGVFDIKLVVGSIICILYLIVIICSDVSTVDYAFIVKSLSVISIYVCFMLLWDCMVQVDFNFDAAMNTLQRLGGMTEESQVTINPNTLGIINVLSISGLLHLHINNNERQKKRQLILEVALLTVMGMLTSSRTFLVCLIIMLVMMIIGVPGDIKKKIQYLSFIVIFFVVLIMVYKWIFPYNYEFFMSRFKEDDIFSGRDTIMSEYNQYISNNAWIALFGIGLSSFTEKIIYIYKISLSVPHNGIQEIIVAWGIPGLIMFISLVYAMINESSKYSDRKELLKYIPLVVVLAKSMAGQLLTSGYTMMALVFAYLSLCQNFKQTEQN